MEDLDTDAHKDEEHAPKDAVPVYRDLIIRLHEPGMKIALISESVLKTLDNILAEPKECVYEDR